MRAFDDTIEDQVSDSDEMVVSDFIIKGYVLSEDRVWQRQHWRQEGPMVEIRSSGNNVKRTNCSYDGFFEFDVKDDTEQTLGLLLVYSHLILTELT